MSKEEQFLREYEKLCQKYRMGLEGCGCCESPYLVGDTKADIGYINYNYQLNKIIITKNWGNEDVGKEKTLDEYFMEI